MGRAPSSEADREDLLGAEEQEAASHDRGAAHRSDDRVQRVLDAEIDTRQPEQRNDDDDERTDPSAVASSGHERVVRADEHRGRLGHWEGWVGKSFPGGELLDPPRS